MTTDSSTSGSEIHDYLRSETENNLKKARRTWALGLFIIFVLFAYLANVYQTIDQLYLEPENLAGMMKHKAENNIASFMAEIEGELVHGKSILR